MNTKEKSGVEVLLIGKRIIVFDDKANQITQLHISSYTWEVEKA